MLSNSQRQFVRMLLIAVFLVAGGLSEVIRPGHEEYMRAGKAIRPGDQIGVDTDKSWVGNSSFQALLPAVLGVREVIASLMWVRADDYFHRGEYRPIMTMIKQIVAIDPHQLDVYATGAWHMAYNFMDKRLIDDGVRFLEDGCKQNDAVYDLYFELGYMHYDKTKNYPAAIQAYTEAARRGTTTGKAEAPSYVRHQKAHAMEKAGDIDAALLQWATNVQIATDAKHRNEPEFGPMAINTAAAKHNLYITQRRLNERLAAIEERNGSAPRALALWEKNRQLAQDWLKEFPGHPDVTKDLAFAELTVARLKEGKLKPGVLLNVEMPFTVVRTAPRKLEISGTINVLDLSRVNVRFQDKDDDKRAVQGTDYKMLNCSREWDNPSVRKGAFHMKLDLDKDPADMERQPSDIYPLKADEYELSVTFDPRQQAAFIQDRYGWNGEGLTARADELVVDPTRAGKMNGVSYPLRLVRKTIILKREDIVGNGKKVLFTSGK